MTCKKCERNDSCTKPYRKQRDGNGDLLHTRTDFSKWINRLPYPFCSKVVDCNNIDFLWFRYGDGLIMTIEEKTYGANQRLNQNESQRIIRDMLLFASNHDDCVVKSNRGKSVKYTGHYLIIFENTNPDDSAWCNINDVRYEGCDVAIAVKYLLCYGDVSQEQIDEYKQRRTHGEISQ